MHDFKNKFYTAFLYACFAVIFGFIFVFSYRAFSLIFFDKESSVRIDFLNAFAGAFFAFLFVRLADFLNRLYERQKRAYDALVKYDAIGNNYLENLNNNIFVINDLIQTAQQSVKTNNAIINFNRIHPFTINENLFHDLVNIALINEIYTYNMDLRKADFSLRSLERFYVDIVELYKADKDLGTFHLNMSIFVEKAEELKIFLTRLMEEDITLVAKIRLFIKYDKPLLTRLLSPIIFRKDMPKYITSELEQEVQGLKSEVEDSRTKSQERIDQLSKN